MYSVIELEVLFENLARMFTEPLLLDLETLKAMVIEVLDTTISFDVGRLELSSGKAELKFQSSSLVTPLLCPCPLAAG